MTAFSASDTTKLATRVKESEGLRLDAYRCPSGALTVGYGHNCDAVPVPGVARVGDCITAATAESLFEADLASAVWAVRGALPWATSLTPPRQAVLYDMAFNMGLGCAASGRGLLSFAHTLRLVRHGDFSEASRRMLASKWARQVGFRAVRLARQLESGEWQ